MRFPSILTLPTHSSVDVTPPRRPHDWVWLIASIGVVWGLFSPQPILLSASWITLPILFHLLWVDRYPPVLLAASLLLWFKGSLQGFYYAGYQGKSLAEVGGAGLIKATWLILTTVVVLAVGVRLALLSLRSLRPDWDRPELSAYSPRRLFYLHVGAFFVAQLILEVGVPGAFYQFVLPLTYLRWVFFFILAYFIFSERCGYKYFVGILVFEIVFGLAGFFSGFKEFIFPLSAAMLAGIKRFRLDHAVAASTVAIILLGLGMFWTAIKPEYRNFLNQDTRSQVVLVPVQDRLGKVLDLAETVDSDELSDTIEPLVERVGYISLFAETISYVPTHKDHQNGKLWKQAIQHVIMPRVLFPSKPVIDDTETMQTYTPGGTGRAGASISLGYIAESYIDFGPFGMFVPIFLVGLGSGLIFRFLLTRTRFPLLGSGFATAILVFTLSGQPATPKLLGGIVTNFVVLTLVMEVGLPYFVDWMQEDASAPAQSSTSQTVPST